MSSHHPRRGGIHQTGATGATRHTAPRWQAFCGLVKNALKIKPRELSGGVALCGRSWAKSFLGLFGESAEQPLSPISRRSTMLGASRARTPISMAASYPWLRSVINVVRLSLASVATPPEEWWLAAMARSSLRARFCLPRAQAHPRADNFGCDSSAALPAGAGSLEPHLGGGARAGRPERPFRAALGLAAADAAHNARGCAAGCARPDSRSGRSSPKRGCSANTTVNYFVLKNSL